MIGYAATPGNFTVAKYAIANVPPRVVAEAAQRYGLSGSVYAGYGFGMWNVEPTTFVEFGGYNPQLAEEFIVGLLRKHGEQCAYRTIDGTNPALVFASGEVEVIV